jgi:hypothetical protein
MTNFQFICLDTTTASKGRWITTNDATVDLDTCRFVDMSTFTFDSNTTAENCTFQRCAQVTTGGADMTGSSFLASTVAADTGALYCDTAYTDTDFDNCTFSMGSNSHHAIDFGTSVTSNLTLRNCSFTGFGSTDDANDSTVRFLATSGSLTLSLVGCTVDGAAASTSNFSVDDAAGVSVTLSIDPVAITVHVDDNDGNDLSGAYVYLKAADGTGDLPFEDTVTIARSGTTATVTHTGHGLNTNEYVKLQGITGDKIDDNNGCHQITLDGGDPTNKYTFTTADSGTYAGTIKSTGVLIYTTTDGNGDATASRTLTLDQPYDGYVRKSSGSPRFKSFTLGGSMSKDNDTTVNIRMVLDE